MTDPVILFRCHGGEVYESGGCYLDRNGLTFRTIHPVEPDYFHAGHLLRFSEDSDIGWVDNEPLDLLLQCLEHRLAVRNLADPMFERTNALEHLRKMRGWLWEIERNEHETLPASD